MVGWKAVLGVKAVHAYLSVSIVANYKPELHYPDR